MNGEDVKARFTARCRPDPGGCWAWTGTTIARGRGVMSVDNKCHTAPRVSWFVRHGRWPPAGLLVCHTCDNPNCVNPDHLFLGTQSDNMRDMHAKGRSGRKHGKGSRGPYPPRPAMVSAGEQIWRALSKRRVSWKMAAEAVREHDRRAAAALKISEAAVRRLRAYAKARALA